MLRVIILISALVLTACSNQNQLNQRATNNYGNNQTIQSQLANYSDVELMEIAKQKFNIAQYADALPYLQLLASHGNAEGQYALGYLYFYGYGVERNPSKAQALFRLSAEKGNHQAIKALGQLTTEASIFSVNKNRPSINNSSAHNAKPVKQNKNITNKRPAKNKPQKTISQYSSKSQQTAGPSLVVKQKTGSYHAVSYNSKHKKLKSNLTKHSMQPSHNSQNNGPTANTANNWLKQQAPDKYTIQIMANRNQSVLDTFVQKNQLTGQANKYSYQYKNKTWYGLSMGVYSNVSEANKALNRLPPALRDHKPWVRQFKQLQKDISN